VSRWNPFRRRSWIESVSREDLEREMLVVENRAQLVAREIQRLEEEKKRLFRQGIGKSTVEKMLLAEKIKDIDMEVKVKMREYSRLMRQRRALSNLARLKEWESRLRERGIWEKIARTEPERLIQLLSQLEFDESQLDRNIEKINEVLGKTMEPLEVDSSTREIMRLWEKVEKGEFEAEEVERQLESKRLAEEEEKSG